VTYNFSLIYYKGTIEGKKRSDSIQVQLELHLVKIKEIPDTGLEYDTKYDPSGTGPTAGGSYKEMVNR